MEAKRYGVNVLESELVGLVPMQALVDCAEYSTAGKFRTDDI